MKTAINTEPDLGLMPSAGVPQIWESYREKINQLVATAQSITVTDTEEVEIMKLARSTRLTLRQIRIDIERKGKELNEGDTEARRQALARMDKTKSEVAALCAIIEPLEARLLEQEQFVEREQARTEADLRRIRTAEIAPFLTRPCSVDLGVMPDEEYQAFLQDLKDAEAYRTDQEQKAATAAKEKELKDEVERKRLKAENDRLREENEAKEAAARAERAEAAKQKAATDAETARIRAELKAQSDADKKRSDDAEREAQAIVERFNDDLREKREAVEKAEAEKAEAARKSATAPDAQKLRELAAEIRALKIPKIAKESFNTQIQNQQEKFALWIERNAEKL